MLKRNRSFRHDSVAILLRITLMLPLFLAPVGCDGDHPALEPQSQADPLLPYLPTLPPPSGPAVARAGRLTTDNFSRERVAGPASQGLIGDYYMANDRIRVVLQQPNRAIAPLPYGGNIIDLDFAENPVGDQFGEVGLFLLTGRTANFTDAEIIRDGSAGGPAVLRFRGADALDDFIDIAALGPIASLFSPRLAADNALGLKLAVTYILYPGASHVEVHYTFYNPSDMEIDTNWGTMTDSGASVWNYVPGIGFADLSIQDLLSVDFRPAEYLAQQGEGLSYGVIAEPKAPQLGSIVVPIAGVAATINDLKNKQDVFSDSSLSMNLPPGKGAQRVVYIAIARGGVDGIERIVRKDIKKNSVRKVTGTLKGTVAGETITIGISKRRESTPQSPKESDVPYMTTIVKATAEQASFETELPAGTYTLQAEGMSHRQSAAVSLSVPDTAAPEPLTLDLVLPTPALIRYRITDVNDKLIPGKITLIGQEPAQLPAAAPTSEHSITGIVSIHHALSGDSAHNTAWDHPIAVAPGTYRIVISRGPEWSRYEQKLTLKSGDQIDVKAALERVIDTTSYLACDFHQHTSNSPDSSVTLEQRVINNLDEGLEFISSSDHDYVTDFRPIIRALSATGLIDSIPGEELTPFGYGHFNSWPIPVDPMSPNGGAFDWGGGEMPNIAPRGLYAGVRRLGAELVQVNHPRLAAPDFLDFQANFDRAALRFDYAARTFYGDKNAMKIGTIDLGLPADAELFADNFDALEVQNGSSSDPPDIDGERHDWVFERVLRDWMNFLSFGFTPVATGNSDTHGVAEAAGLPRTLVRVPDDSPAQLSAGAADAINNTLLGRGGARRDVIVSNGPFLQLQAGSGKNQTGIGGTTSPDAGILHIEVEVRSPDWMPITTVEVFANNTFDSPEPAIPAPLLPALCFSTQKMLTPRCAQAPIHGALNVEVMTTPRGGHYFRYRVSVDAEVSKLLHANRPGSRGQDLWLVARCFGDRSMFPVMPHGINPGGDLNRLLNGIPLYDEGVFPNALTNPIFVDVDGGGWRAPFQP